MGRILPLTARVVVIPALVVQLPVYLLVHGRLDVTPHKGVGPRSFYIVVPGSGLGTRICTGSGPKRCCELPGLSLHYRLLRLLTISGLWLQPCRPSVVLPPTPTAAIKYRLH